MKFMLDDSLRDDVIFAMEDQTSISFVDANTASVVSFSHGQVPPESGERFYPLPEWSSADGFALMEDFAEKCRIPQARSQLKDCLQSGRGVFKSFKAVLKSYPRLEKRWLSFKRSAMLSRVNEWYALLRESWGLEALPIDGPECETQELLMDDFVFSNYDYLADEGDTLQASGKAVLFFNETLGGGAGEAAGVLLAHLAHFCTADAKVGSVCRLQTGEFVGCFLCAPLTASAALAVDLFVEEDFRGLGVARQLVSCCAALLKASGFSLLVFAVAFAPEYLENVLSQIGFQKAGSGWAMDLLAS